MTVEELRDTLTRLVELLRAADAKAGTVRGLAEFVELTAGFGELSLKAFVKLAEAGRAPVPKATPAPERRAAAKSSADPAEVLREVTGLYERAAEPDVTEARMRAACDRLGGLKKDALVRVAEEVGLQGMKSKTIPAIVAAVTGRLLDRKGAAIRSQLIDRPTAPGDVPSAAP